MKKPDYAKAMELRVADVELDKKFNTMADEYKWKWLAYACNHKPHASIAFARQLVAEHAASGAT